MSIVSRTTPFREAGIELVSFTPVNGLNYPNDPPPEVVPDVPFLYSALNKGFEVMTPNSGGGRGQWKNWQHYKRVTDFSSAYPPLHPTVQYTPHGGYSGSWYYSGTHSDPLFGYSSTHYGEPDNPTKGLFGMYNPEFDTEGDDFITDPSNLAQLLDSGYKAMMPEIKAELSSINSLYELKDIASLRSTLTNIRSLPKLLLKSGAKRLREILRSGSDAYLQWSFNISPLVSDISGIYAALDSYERKLNALITRSAKKQRRHYTRTLTEMPHEVSKSANYGLGAPQLVYPSVSGLNYMSRQAIQASSKFHMMIEYNFRYSQYQLEHARVLALLDAFGVNLNPSIIWNALPWSFVIDWVIGVNRWLEQFTVQNMEPQINIHRMSWSIARSRTIAVQCEIGNNPFGYGSDGPRSQGTTYEVAYKRQVGMPSSSSIISSGLTPREFSLGAALVLSRRRRRKR